MTSAINLTKFGKLTSPAVATMNDMNNTAATKFREPYRATKLWLEAVAIFRRGVPIGKHRKQWRTYENCFPAQDAITWFQSQLQVAFDPSITRKQTLKLLQKFYKANIIAEVTRSPNVNQRESPFVINETDFKDNGQLYRLVCTNGSPKKEAAAAATSVNYDTKSLKKGVMKSPMPSQLSKSCSNYDVIIKTLTQEEIHAIWEKCFMNKFVQIVGCDVFNSFYRPGIIKGSCVLYNLTNVGPRNIVQCANKSHDLPHWLISAMKCLANWPSDHTQETGVPNYPGFENDVFKLVSDYFTKFQKNNPLLTFDLYDAFITTFIRAELFDFNSRLYSAKMNNASRSRIFQYQHQGTPVRNGPFCSIRSPMFRMEDQYPFNASESVENLILDILTPSTSKPCQRRNRNILQSRNIDSDPRKKLFHIPAKEDVINEADYIESPQVAVNPPPPMQPHDYDLDRYTLPLFYETAFTGNNSPITRVVSQTELKASLGTKSKSTSRIQVRPPASSAGAILDRNSYAYENPVLDLSASDMINHPKYTDIRNEIATDDTLKSRASPVQSFMNYTVLNEDSGHESGISSGTNSFLEDRFGGLPPRAVSAVNLSDMNKARDRRQFVSTTLPRQIHVTSQYQNKEGGNRFSTAYTPGGNMPSLAAQYAQSPRLMTREGKNLAIISFRLLTLLLPPENRRHLQILLRFMSKTSRNEKLMLDVATSTRAIIINTFFRLIMLSEDPFEYDELLALRIVTFLMDNDQEIFATEHEEDIISDSQEEISRQQILKVPAREKSATPVKPKPMAEIRVEAIVNENTVFVEANKENKAQYCSRISMDEYDDQRLLSSTSKSLRDLLDSWVGSNTMDPKEKRRQVLKFKEEYPHIYQEKFGDDDPSFLNESRASKTKKEKRSWNVFKALRL